MRDIVIHLKSVKRSIKYGEVKWDFEYKSELQDLLDEPFGGKIGINVYSDTITLILPRGMRYYGLRFADPYFLGHLIETYNNQEPRPDAGPSTYTSKDHPEIVKEIAEEILGALQ